jgi:TolB-like protein
VAALALAVAGCAAHAPVRPAIAPGPGYRIALLPLENRAGASAPTRQLSDGVELALRRRGFEVVAGGIVGDFLQRHRIRSVSGIDREASRAAREELGVEGVLVVTLESYVPRPYPRLGFLMRLIAAGDEPEVLWADGYTLAGDESPGLLGLGLVRSMETVQRRVLDRLTGSLMDRLQGRAVARLCASDGRFDPKIGYQAPQLRRGKPITVAVLPFVNETDRRHAGEVVAAEFLRQLNATDAFRVVEPGEVRDGILRNRLIMEGGVSLDYARILLTLVQADVVITGIVRDYRDGEPPRVAFTAFALEQESQRIVWQGTSYSLGDDGVFFFDAGYVKTADELACRMVRRSIAQMSRGVGSAPAATAQRAPGAIP